MNNGEYVGPLISRTSPRWRMQEYYAFANQGSAGSLQNSLIPGIFEPYFPPSVSAVMVTATAGYFNASTTITTSAGACINVVFPLKDRRFFVEINAVGAMYLYLVNEAALIGSASGQISPSICEHTLFLQNNAAPLIYSQSATQYISVGNNTSVPWLNGVVYGRGSFSFSIANPTLRQAGASNPTVPGHLFFPIKANYGDAVTPGTGNTRMMPAYVRTEYMV